jgi:8-hydroxy-5-deazaflavin:NADPH oxidoreductase
MDFLAYSQWSKGIDESSFALSKTEIMQTKQTIAVIGATGNMGSAISKTLSKGNYRLLLGATDLEKLETLVNEIRSLNASADVEGINCPVDASWEADIIIAAVPFNAEKEVAEKIREVANQKIVISIANPLNETYNGLVTDPGTSAAEELQKLLPNSKVVKAFNTTFAADFNTPVIDGKKVDAFIAGDDDEAVKIVSELVSTAGFNPIIAGDLSVSGTLERMQLLLIQLGMRYNYNWLAGWKILHN